MVISANPQQKFEIGNEVSRDVTKYCEISRSSELN